MHTYAPEDSLTHSLSLDGGTLSSLLSRLAKTGVKEAARRLLALALGSLIVTYAVLRLAGQPGSFLLLWPVSGFALGAILTARRGGWQQHVASPVATVCGVFLGAVAAGQPRWMASGWALLTLCDTLLAGSLLSPHIATLEDLKKRANVVRFVAVTTGTPLLSGLAITLPAALLHVLPSHGAPWLQTVGMSVFADLLGIAIVLPAVLFATTGEYRALRKLAPHLRYSVAALVLYLAVTVFTFWQNQGPLLFIIFPPMMLMLLLMGLEGAVFSTVALSAIGWYATAHGHGPIWLMREGSPATHSMVLQGFIWVCLATALPVGALLDERRRAERGVLEAQAVYQLLLQHTDDAIVLSSSDGPKRFVSAAIEQLTGWTPEEYLAIERLETMHPDDRDMILLMDASFQQGKREQIVRYRIRLKHGGWRWVEATVRGYGSVGVTGYVITIRDISAQKQAETDWQAERHALAQEKQQMADLAGTDALTGLLNRRGLEQGVRETVFGKDLAVLMIDIDFFKQFNDFYGHGEGDRCLTRLGAVIRKQVGRKGDLVARLGGEEFTVVLPGGDAQAGLRIAEGICLTLEALAMEHTSSPLGFVSVSIGVAVHTAPSEVDFNLLLSQADRALYTSKHAGKNRATLFQPGPSMSLMAAKPASSVPAAAAA